MNQNARGSVGKGKGGEERGGEEGRGEGRSGAHPGWCGEGGGFPGAFISPFFFRFFLGEGRGKPVEVQGCDAVVQGRRGASLLLSSPPLPTATLNQNGFGARGSVVFFPLFFLVFSGTRRDTQTVMLDVEAKDSTVRMFQCPGRCRKELWKLSRSFPRSISEHNAIV